MVLFIAICSLMLSLAALVVARRSSEREKRLVVAQRRSDMISAVRETRLALGVQVMNLDAMLELEKDAVQNARLARLFDDAKRTDKQLADLRARLESTMIPQRPPPSVFRDLDDITVDAAAVRRELDHHAEEAAELRGWLDARKARERAG